MAGDNRLVTENFLRLNFTPNSGITAGTNDTLKMSCDQILARYAVSISGVTTTGTRLPGQNQLASGITPPSVTTAALTAITETTATSGGNVTADGGASVTVRGVCWSTSTNPTTANSHTSDGTGTGSFSSYLTSLTAATTYYVRAYATNSAGTAYGSNVSFVALPVSSGYGKLYSMYPTFNAKNIAASGWHVPSLAEWNTLITYLGGASVAGGKMKEAGTTHWDAPNTGASNSSGFNGFGAGTRDGYGYYINFNRYAEFWTADASGGGRYYTAALRNEYADIYIYSGGFGSGDYGSIRLIKDDATLETYTGNDGVSYTTVMIGSQVWMSQNLRETKYRDGTDIGNTYWKWFNNNSGYE